VYLQLFITTLAVFPSRILCLQTNIFRYDAAICFTGGGYCFPAINYFIFHVNGHAYMYA